MLRALFRFDWWLAVGRLPARCVVMATGAQAGMSQDLASCTAAKNRSAAAACTRVMDSGRLPRAADVHRTLQSRHAPTGAPATLTKAVSDFTKVLELKPDFARAYEARGMTEDDRGNRDKALADIDEAIKRDGKAWQLLYSRAVVLRADGDTDGALRDLDAAGDLNAEAANIPLMRALDPRRQGLLRGGARRDQPCPFRRARRRLGALRAGRRRLRGRAHRRSRRRCRPRARAWTATLPPRTCSRAAFSKSAATMPRRGRVSTRR